jgi:hypothetical protein
MEFVFITKIIPNIMKGDVIVRDTLGYFFRSTWYDINCFEKIKGG